MPQSQTTTLAPQDHDHETEHDCLLQCGNLTTHQSGVCDECARPDTLDLLDEMVWQDDMLIPMDEAA
jgi:hypothetical protein